MNSLPQDRDFVQSLAKGLSVLRAFGADHPSMTLAEVARSTDMTRASARRLLLTLEQLGYVRSDGKNFELGAQVLDLGYAFVSSLGIPAIAQPHIENLSLKLHESSSVAVLDGAEIVYVARVPTQRIMTISLALGSRLPAHMTSMGRVLLAELPPDELAELIPRLEFERPTKFSLANKMELLQDLDAVSNQGFALLDQELEIGLRSIAAPLRDRMGRVVAAVNVSSHAGRTTEAQLRNDFVPVLLETAEAINESLALRT